MKKFISFIILLIIIPLLLYAQNNKIGILIIGGINFYSLKYNSTNRFIPAYTSKLSYEIGGGTNFYLTNKFYLEVDILYKVKKSELIRFSGVEWSDVFYKFKYLAIPILTHYKFSFSKFNVFTTLGMESDFLLKSLIEDKRNDVILETTEDTNSIDFQLISGLGIKYKKLSVEFRYGMGLLNLNMGDTKGLIVKNMGFEFLITHYF